MAVMTSQHNRSHQVQRKKYFTVEKSQKFCFITEMCYKVWHSLVFFSHEQFLQMLKGLKIEQTLKGSQMSCCGEVIFILFFLLCLTPLERLESMLSESENISKCPGEICFWFCCGHHILNIKKSDLSLLSLAQIF